MPSKTVIPLRAPRRPGASGSRYKLVASNTPVPVVRIEDRQQRVNIMRWQGESAARLMKRLTGLSDKLPETTRALDKTAVQQIALLGAAVALAERDGRGLHDATSTKSSTPVTGAVGRRRRTALPSLHRCVAQEMLRHVGRHLEEGDAIDVALLQCPSLDRRQVRQALGDLCDWGILQCIDVAGHRFFDTDTRPHLHIFDRRRGELLDAPASGVVETG